MIDYTQAQDILWRAAKERELETEEIPLSDIHGRISADHIIAPMDIQPFDNAAMDGFAVLCDDLKYATNDNPVTLQKANVIAAGDPVSTTALQSGQCIHIMTGAPMPQGANAVVPIEQAQLNGNNITFTDKPKNYAHIRFAGEDFKKGVPLLKSGDLLNTSHILPLATLGISKVLVFKKPKIAFMATGKELIDDLSQPLQSGQIYNSNRPYALAFLKSIGCDVHPYNTIHDTVDDFTKTLHDIMDQNIDIVVSSGAVSAGAFDFVKDGLKNIGAEILYHKIKLKPGKPNLLARLPNGSLYFGLPGNPVASAVGLRFFVATAISALNKQCKPLPLRAQNLTPFSKKGDLHIILKGKMDINNAGQCRVSVLDGQASFMTSPFLNMDMWIHVPQGQDHIDEGDMVDVYPLMP